MSKRVTSQGESAPGGKVVVSRRSRSLSVETRRGWPVTIEWNGRREAVREIIDVWVVEGEWWRGSRRRVYFRVRMERRTIDIYHTGDNWMLSRAWD